MPEKILLVKMGRQLHALSKRVKLDHDIEKWLDDMERRGYLDDPKETLAQEGIR
jgi:hypothetical protein